MGLATTAISLRGLTKRFGASVAVDGLTFDLPHGGVIGFVGPNGSGKSTTIRMLLGLMQPSGGSASVLGHPIETPNTYAHRVGALIESPAFVPTISARANLRSLAHLRGVSPGRVDHVLKQVGLLERAGDKVRIFSLGMKQRLAIALALLGDPELLVLDEPTNGLDPAGIVEVRDLLRSLAGEGRTVLVSSHLLAEIQAAADHLVLIRNGSLLFNGPLAELLQRERHFVEVEPEHPSQLDTLANAIRARGYDAESEGIGLRVRCAPEQSPDLHRAAAEADIALRKLIPHAGSLEDVFLGLTSESAPGEER